MKVIPIFPGSFYVTDGEKSLLAGCPPEIVKVMLQKCLASPQAILLPDQPISRGESQVAVEFPLYHHLFFNPKKELKPLLLVGSTRRVEAAKELLHLSLFGPDAEQMKAWGMPAEQADALAREIRWFHLKDKDGKPVTMDKMVATASVEDNEADLGWVKISRVRPNVFKLAGRTGTVTVDLTLTEDQAPPYPVNTDLTVTTLVKFGIEVLGGSSGFSVTQACSGMAMCYNGNYMLVDAIPFLNYHLKARGVARNQVHSIFLSHIHDDHCNLISLLQYNRRMQVLTTPVVFRMMLRKLSLILDRPEESLTEYFDFIPLTPGEDTDFFGLRITPFWSSHSIPTIGAQFETVHAGNVYRMIFTSDTQSLKDVKRLQTTGVVTPARFSEISDLYRKAAHLLVADGGEGVIHGDPSDALESPADRVVFMHLDKLPDQFQAQFTVASSGKRFTVVRGNTDYNLTRTIEFLLEYFPEMPPVWISNLLANQQVFAYNAGDIIIRQGSRSEGFVYMILTGYAQVVLHDGQKKSVVAQMEAGELIGEMSVITGKGQRNASVVAHSPVIVTAFSETAFYGFIQHQGLEEKLKSLWQNRELVQNFSCLKLLQQPVIRAMSARLTLHNLPPRSGKIPLQDICPPGGLLFPLGLEIAIAQIGKTETVPSHVRPVLGNDRDELITEAEFQYLLLTPEDAAALRRSIPAFRFFWEETLGLPIQTPAAG
ncbi:MAG: cyclic nucleotide-binding domain-containing protein [Verrucomicrobia bacterium]|nr:cyclic nucleotide-binding domain-containing protein [Verrucomicrobiota bacterium]